MMNTIFYISSAVAIISTVLVITRIHVMHALLYFIVSLLSVALIFVAIGAPFIAALEVIIYAGAIMVLFVFVVMMINLGPQAVQQEKQWLRPGMWAGPAVLALVLFIELLYVFMNSPRYQAGTVIVGPKHLGVSLFGPYLLGVELASFLLMGGLIGAYHLGRRIKKDSSSGEVIQ